MRREEMSSEIGKESVDPVPRDDPKAGESLRRVEDLGRLHHQEHVLQHLGNGVALMEIMVNS